MCFITMWSTPEGETMSTGTHRQQIEATIVRYDDEVDTCTLHPSDPDEENRTTEWITAEKDGYVHPAEWR